MSDYFESLLTFETRKIIWNDSLTQMLGFKIDVAINLFVYNEVRNTNLTFSGNSLSSFGLRSRQNDSHSKVNGLHGWSRQSADLFDHPDSVVGVGLTQVVVVGVDTAGVSVEHDPASAGGAAGLVQAQDRGVRHRLLCALQNLPGQATGH